MSKDSGKVKIHGKEYETVASRVKRFREDNKTGFGIATEIVSIDEDTVVMKATITQDGAIIATGHAEEKRTASTINRTSALENCETSAIGRALAAFGYLGTEFASADEVAQAISQQNELIPVKKDEPITVNQIKLLGSKLKWAYMAVKEPVDNDSIVNELTTILGKDADKVMKSEMDEAIAKVEARVQKIKTLPKDKTPLTDIGDIY